MQATGPGPTTLPNTNALAAGTESQLRPYVAMGLVSCAVLLYQVAITRVLSVVLWYHFVFLAVSLAMLGLGLPGVWFSLRRPGPAALPRVLLAAGITTPLSVIALLRSTEITSAVSELPSLSLFLHSGMLLVLVCVLVPLLALGSAVCLLLMSMPGKRVGRMYAADLLGAALAAALVVPLMHWLPTPTIVAGAGLLPLAAAALMVERARWLSLLLAVATVGALVDGRLLTARATKSYVEPDDILHVEWTPTARLVVFPNVFYVEDPEAGFGWGMGSKYEPQPIEQLWLEQDSSAGTPITRLEGRPEDLPHLLYDVTSLAYQLRDPGRVCVIGAGGGRDVLTALAAGAEHVDAVELNGSIVDIVSEHFQEFSGNLYEHERVNAVVSEGRSFLTLSDGGYDLIQVSLIDSWAATAAGAFALSENYLYTTEALELYLDRLSDDGILTISRWIEGPRQLESGRLAAMVQQVLKSRGAEEPARHLYVARAWDAATFVINPRPFTAAEIERLDAVSRQRGFQRYWPLGGEAPQTSLLASVLTGNAASYQDKGFDLAPATDDKPFFFQTVSLLASMDQQDLAKLSNNEHSVSMLKVLLMVISALTLALFLAPFALRRRLPGARSGDLWTGSGYFLAMGLGFMLVEMPWLQRFVLYLGHPSYATTVVLAVLLLGAGIGSLLAARIQSVRITSWGLLLPLSVVVINTMLQPVYSATLGWPFAARVLMSIALLLPSGILMGFALPTGLAVFSEQSKPWFWAVNGVASVLASVFSLALAMMIGLSSTVWAGAVLYAVAWLLLWMHVRPKAVLATGGPQQPVGQPATTHASAA